MQQSRSPYALFTNREPEINLESIEFELTEVDTEIQDRTYFHGKHISRQEAKAIVEEAHKNKGVNTAILIAPRDNTEFVLTCYFKNQAHEYYLSPRLTEETEEKSSTWNGSVEVVTEKNRVPIPYDSLNAALVGLATQYHIKKILNREDFITYAPEFARSGCFRCVIL